MAKAGEKAKEQLEEITNCSICMSLFNDPRMLPCIHTFCLECLKRTSEAAQMKPGDKMPCPLCRKEFIIPVDGMNGVQRNFFMENLLEFKTTLQMGSATTISDTENDTISEMKRPFTTMYCSKHTKKPLDYYCADCKKIVCVSCFVESHSLHKCKDVTTVEEEFRQTIQRNSSKVSIHADEMLSLRKNAEKRKADFLKEIVDKESKILKRNQELKDMIDEHTKSLLDELSEIKSKHLKEMKTGMEEIDRYRTILNSFEFYCNELTLKGSASDICSSVDKLIVRADELRRYHEAFISLPRKSVEVSFQATDLREVMFNNCLGQIKALSSEENAVTSYSGQNSDNVGASIASVEDSVQEERELRPLPGFIELTTEPDMITYDDDPNTRRAKMPCGHVIGPESMTDYFRDILDNGKFTFICPSLKCNCEWEYFLVRHVACLTDEEMQEFEKKLENNFLEKEKGKQTCPGCKTWCVRSPGSCSCVRCPICTANNGKKFYFCWVCLNEWKSFWSSGPCGNPGCGGKEKGIDILASCPTKRINLCMNCPRIRRCPKCGLLIEHQDKSGHTICRNCQCRFCFICLKVYEDGESLCNFLGTCQVAPRQVP